MALCSYRGKSCRPYDEILTCISNWHRCLGSLDPLSCVNRQIPKWDIWAHWTWRRPRNQTTGVNLCYLPRQTDTYLWMLPSLFLLHLFSKRSDIPHPHGMARSHKYWNQNSKCKGCDLHCTSDENLEGYPESHTKCSLCKRAVRINIQKQPLQKLSPILEDGLISVAGRLKHSHFSAVIFKAVIWQREQSGLQDCGF